jgi:hypothetical protein
MDDLARYFLPMELQCTLRTLMALVASLAYLLCIPLNQWHQGRTTCQ